AGRGSWGASSDAIRVPNGRCCLKGPRPGVNRCLGHKRDAQIACSKLIAETKAGSYVEPSKLTLAQFFDRWLKHIKPNVSPRTHERYEQIATKNIVPLLGAKMLSQLHLIDISGAYGKALESGRRDGKGGLSPRTVHHMHRVLYSALGQAERWKL